MSEPILECLGLEKVFTDFWGRPRVRALHPLTLDLHPGEILALLGPNGAGKSTAIKLILGLLFPTRGVVRLFGGSPSSASIRARVGYLPEETKLHRFLNARETLDLFGRLHGVTTRERKRRIDELIEMVGLRGNESRPVGEFSKGMARRIGLAVALAGDPDLLILDEPTSGLDPLGTREIKDLIQALRERGRTVLLSSHLLDDVEDVADRIAILYGGQLQRLGRTDELLQVDARVRIELDRGSQDLSVIERRVREALPEAATLEVSTPSDRLESLFRRVVAAARQQHLATAGAQAGGVVASFLGEHAAGPRTPPAPTPSPARPPTPVPEPLRPPPQPEPLQATPSPAPAPPAAPVPAAPVPDAPVPAPVVERLAPAAAADSAPSSSTHTAEVVASLLGTAPPNAGGTPPAAAPDPTGPGALPPTESLRPRPEVESTGNAATQAVLSRLLQPRRDRPS